METISTTKYKKKNPFHTFSQTKYLFREMLALGAFILVEHLIYDYIMRQRGFQYGEGLVKVKTAKVMI